MTSQRPGGELEIEGRRLRLTNLDKPLYPTGFTKSQLIDYYIRISGVMLPHLRSRPLTLKRYPDGVDGESFYEKNCPGHRPGWVRTIRMEGRGGGPSGAIDYCSADDLPTLVWLANLAAIELHPLLAVSEDLERPTSVVFDLDPGEGAGVLDCARVACSVRATLSSLGLRCFPKSSGSKGLQVYLPLNSAHRYDETKAFALALAEGLARQQPSLVVSNMRRSLRAGRVLVDWSQNDSAKTTIGVYSLRARETPAVSAPLAWEELERALAEDDPGSLRIEADQALRRVESVGDLFAPVLELRQRLPAASGG